MKHIGTCAVIHPKRLRIEFIEFDDTNTADAQRLLELAKSSAAANRGSDTPSHTKHPISHVEPANQEVFGALCAALFEFTMTGNANERFAKAAALGIYMLRPSPVFLVHAKELDGGTQSNYSAIDCEDLSQAHKCIEQTQEVRMLRDFQEMQGLMTKASSKGPQT